MNLTLTTLDAAHALGLLEGQPQRRATEAPDDVFGIDRASLAECLSMSREEAIERWFLAVAELHRVVKPLTDMVGDDEFERYAEMAKEHACEAKVILRSLRPVGPTGS